MKNIKARSKEILKRLVAFIPDPKTELNFSSPYEALVAVILSAQCTDKRVNLVTPQFFKKWPDAKSLAGAEVDEIKKVIGSINFFNNKSKNLSLLGMMLVMKYDGKVPNTQKELVALPGVGVKTANVILSVVFDVPAMAVDTHVFRVSHRLGLTTAKTVEKTGEDLCTMIPKKMWSDSHHLFILFGRYTCKAIKPLCSTCPLLDICPYDKKNL